VIVFGHWLLGAYFTATSFRMVRPQVTDLTLLEIGSLNDGEPLKQAIIEAGAVRTSPIL
jgi:hypothetical protein